MQWTVELKLSTDVVRDIGMAWESIGAHGPYQRYRSLDVDPDGLVTHDFLEKQNNDLDIPDKWPTVESLVSSWIEFTEK